jgi:rhodanese-related sulfurtransferase/DNA-directed RNA polymerase subunit RPC12/RpoP
VKQFIGLLLVINFICIFTANSFEQPAKKTLAKSAEQYVCPPCGNDCDKIVYDKPGTCPHCQMQLVKKSSITFGSIEPSQVRHYIRLHPDVVLLDVRTKEEFEGKADPNYGTLKNAINIPVQELQNRLSELSYLKKKKIIVYCSHSHRSATASYLLTQNGFPNVLNMSGGMSVVHDRTIMVNQR